MGNRIAQIFAGTFLFLFGIISSFAAYFTIFGFESGGVFHYNYGIWAYVFSFISIAIPVLSFWAAYRSFKPKKSR